MGRKHREDDVSYKPHLQGTSPGGTQFGIGKGKPGRYEQLHDSTSDGEVPSSRPSAEPYAPGGFPSSGDVGAVGAMDRSSEQGDELRKVHPMPADHGGNGDEDTKYHGAQSDPRSQWGRPGHAF